MDRMQKAAVYRLLAAMEDDEETLKDAKNHGDWYEYLINHINSEEEIEK